VSATKIFHVLVEEEITYRRTRTIIVERPIDDDCRATEEYVEEACSGEFEGGPLAALDDIEPTRKKTTRFTACSGSHPEGEWVRGL